MLIPRRLVLLLIYTGVLLGESLAGRRRNRDSRDIRDSRNSTEVLVGESLASHRRDRDSRDSRNSTGELIGGSLSGRKRDRDSRDSRDRQSGSRDRDENRRDRNQARRQKNKEQEAASSSLSQAIESHHMYGKDNNPDPHESHDHKGYSNSTRVIAPYQISQYDHPRPGRLL